MKPWHVTLAEDAQADIKDIHDYIALELLSPQAAASQAGKIFDAIDDLAVFPKKYPLCRISGLEGMELRATSAGRYRIFYKVFEECGEVLVAGVLYEGCDAAKIFSRNSFT